MGKIHTYISSRLSTINNATYGNVIRTAIADAIRYLDETIVNSGTANSFVVLTKDEYDALTPEEKTATAYFIVE